MIEYNKILTAIMRMSDDEYSQFEYQTGLQYITEVLDGDEWGTLMLSGTKHYWAWWKNHFNSRNRKLVINHNLHQIAPGDYDNDTRVLVRELFAEVHDVNLLNIHPNRIILEASYREMVDDILKDLQHGQEVMI